MLVAETPPRTPTDCDHGLHDKQQEEVTAHYAINAGPSKLNAANSETHPGPTELRVISDEGSPATPNVALFIASQHQPAPSQKPLRELGSLVNTLMQTARNVISSQPQGKLNNQNVGTFAPCPRSAR